VLTARRRSSSRGGGIDAGRTLVGALLLVMTGCAAASPPATAPMLRPQVIAETPHDTAAFTEGLELVDGTLYESTGLAGRSELRELDPLTGAVRRAVALPGRVFGEGMTVVGDRIWVMTYQDRLVLEYDRATLALLRRLPLDDEGWGLCSDGARLVRSNGTDRLTFADPVTFANTGSVAVVLDGRPVDDLNELDCADGQVWANVWKTDRIVRIDPATGQVTAVVDAAGLLPPQRRAGTDVLNGIASAGDGEYLLTGKFWPTTFRVRFTAPT
jgi:glutaminyl-peptide cyclotransferase